MKPVRWGIISTARHGTEKVVPSMIASPLIDVVAIASRNEDNARHWAKELGIPKAYGSYEEMLADPEIEAVYNVLPNHLHVPMTIQAAKAGKHVLCEKPMAMSVKDAERLREVPDGILVAEAFMLRHHLQWKEVRRLLDANEIGEIGSVQTILNFYVVDPDNVRNKADIGGGTILDQGCYAAGVSRFVYGKEPKRVVSLVQFDPKLKIDSKATIIFDFGEGLASSAVVSSQLAAHERVNISGTAGRIEVLEPFGTPLDGSTEILIDRVPLEGRMYKGQLRWDVVKEPERIKIPPCNQYRLQAEAFSRAVRGEEPLKFGLEDAISNAYAVEAIRRSAKAGGWVDVRP